MKTMVLGILGAYKRFVSPALPKACRFVPTCSEYAMEAVDRHGIVRGAMLAAWRVLRCNPFGRGGYDPVPLSEDDRALRRCCPISK
jgi:putative membrane protein insertion efficiency factor